MGIVNTIFHLFSLDSKGMKLEESFKIVPIGYKKSSQDFIIISIIRNAFIIKRLSVPIFGTYIAL
jgi:hypothetical protein